MQRSSKVRQPTRAKASTRSKSAVSASRTRSSTFNTLSVNVTPSRAHSMAVAPQSSFGRAATVSVSTKSAKVASASTKRSMARSFSANTAINVEMVGNTKSAFVSPVVTVKKATASPVSITNHKFSTITTTPMNKPIMSAPIAAPMVMKKNFAPVNMMMMATRSFSAAVDPRNFLRDPKEVESRILDVLKTFEKIDQDKLRSDAHFQKDLGLDSLDRVEVMLAVEEEFGLEFSDEVSDRIASIDEAVTHISQLPDHEFKFAV